MEPPTLVDAPICAVPLSGPLYYLLFRADCNETSPQTLRTKDLFQQWRTGRRKKPDPIDASYNYRATVAAAKSLVVFEGLPHQRGEKELFATEAKRADIKKVLDYPFYTPSVSATNEEELRKLLSSSAAIAEFGGAKACGGYHPDYCISRKTTEATYYALICFGCGEIVFYNG